MILAAAITGLVVLIANFLALFLLYRVYRAEKKAIFYILQSYFEPPDVDTPSEFARTTDAIGKQFASSISSSLKSTFMGMQSVDSKNQARLEGDLVTDLAGQQSPMLAALLSTFPAVQKRLAKNPSLWPMAEQLLAKLAAGKERTGSGGNNSTDWSGLMNKYGGK